MLLAPSPLRSSVRQGQAFKAGPCPRLVSGRRLCVDVHAAKKKTGPKTSGEYLRWVSRSHAQCCRAGVADGPPGDSGRRHVVKPGRIIIAWYMGCLAGLNGYGRGLGGVLALWASHGACWPALWPDGTEGRCSPAILTSGFVADTLACCHTPLLPRSAAFNLVRPGARWRWWRWRWWWLCH